MHSFSNQIHHGLTELAKILLRWHLATPQRPALLQSSHVERNWEVDKFDSADYETQTKEAALRSKEKLERVEIY